MSWPSDQPTRAEPTDIALERWHRQFAANDAAAGIELDDSFARFSQMHDMFTRAFWDDTVRNTDSDAFFSSYRIEAAPRRGDGFALKDFALRNAAWSISDMFSDRGAEHGEREGFQAPMRAGTPVAAQQLVVEDKAAFTAQTKAIARLFGADLAGVAEFDPRWHYTQRVDVRTFSPVANELPDGLTHVLVLGHAMDTELVATYPSALAGAATGIAYSHEAAIVTQVASYLRNLGFQAIGSMNDTALVIPYALKAGLGEYGRNQLVITPEFGPRVRFSKIFTNAPLVADAPRKYGIRQYCDICHICADACPPKALPQGPPTSSGAQLSSIRGVVKWTSDAQKCFGYWAKLKTDCAICMRVCPFNRDYSKPLARLFFALATSPLRRLMHWFVQRRSPSARVKPRTWWASHSKP